MRAAAPAISIAAALIGCSYHGGVGGSTYATGSTQDDVTRRLSSQERVLFRDDRMMIVDGPNGARQLRFDDAGRLQTDMPHGSGGGGGSGNPRGLR